MVETVMQQRETHHVEIHLAVVWQQLRGSLKVVMVETVMQQGETHHVQG